MSPTGLCRRPRCIRFTHILAQCGLRPSRWTAESRRDRERKSCPARHSKKRGTTLGASFGLCFIVERRYHNGAVHYRDIAIAIAAVLRVERQDLDPSCRLASSNVNAERKQLSELVHFAHVLAHKSLVSFATARHFLPSARCEHRRSSRLFLLTPVRSACCR